MSESKEASLNNSYFGPTIPEQTPSTKPRSIYHRKLSPYCLLCATFKAFTVLLIAIGILVLILWLAFQPDTLKVYVDSATLTQFDLNPNNTLVYNLSLNVSLRNPNKKIGIYYKHIRAVASYGSLNLGEEDFARFHQRRKSTMMLNVSFNGEASTNGDSGIVETSYKREKREGGFYISVKMYTRVRLKMIGVKSKAYSPDVNCNLRVPATTGNGTVVVHTVGRFVRTQCDVQSFL